MYIMIITGGWCKRDTHIIINQQENVCTIEDANFVEAVTYPGFIELYIYK